MNIAMILAGGVGSRMAAGKPKQFVEVLGRPVIAYTIERFQRCRAIDTIEVVCVESYIEDLYRIVEDEGFGKVSIVVPGGETYQRSVVNGLMALEGVCAAGDIVVTHMAANPIVNDDLIEDSIRVAREHRSAISLNDITLCVGMRSDDGNFTERGVDRDSLAALNTPQSLEYSFFRDLYARADREGVLQSADPHITSLIYAMGERMYFSKGSPLNIKLTTKGDLEFFEAYLVARERKGEVDAVS